MCQPIHRQAADLALVSDGVAYVHGRSGWGEQGGALVVVSSDTDAHRLTRYASGMGSMTILISIMNDRLRQRPRRAAQVAAQVWFCLCVGGTQACRQESMPALHNHSPGVCNTAAVGHQSAGVCVSWEGRCENHGEPCSSTSYLDSIIIICHTYNS